MVGGHYAIVEQLLWRGADLAPALKKAAGKSSTIPENIRLLVERTREVYCGRNSFFSAIFKFVSMTH
jgi:hypothetical protein